MRIVFSFLTILAMGWHGLADGEELELIETPRFDSVKQQTLDWFAVQNVTATDIKERVAQLWVEPAVTPTASEMFERTIETFRLAQPQVEQFVAACRLGAPAVSLPSLDAIEGPGANEFYRTNLTQFFGVFLVRQKLYDEALIAFERVNLALSVDPPGFLFHLAVAQSQLLMKEEGLATIEKLTKKTEAVPPRYMTVANLMEYELTSLEEDSLGEVAHRMRDVERRLSLGRGGQQTQKKEAEIITLLDDIIKKAEQSNSGGSGEGNGGNSNNPGGGAKESVVKGTTAPGETDEKELKKQAGWGALPDAEVTRAKNLFKQMNFPEHYRRATEAYFRKSAGRTPPK